MKKTLAIAIAASLVSVHGVARADADEDACIAAYEETQTLMKDGKLVAARAEAAVCGRDACPKLLVKDCVRWMRDLDASTPSVLLEAHDERGAPITNVRVSVDGAPVASRIDRAPIALDPGKHLFRFEAGGATWEESVLLREGEKNRRVIGALAFRAEDREGSRPVPAGVWIFGGASIVSLGVTAAFTIDGLGDRDASALGFRIADVALGAGVVAAVTAAYLFFTRPTVAPEARR